MRGEPIRIVHTSYGTEPLPESLQRALDVLTPSVARAMSRGPAAAAERLRPPHSDPADGATTSTRGEG
ncbi:MAG: hypothetical protein K6T78_14940 [Alicyclobacillus sp.]|nr:hypothetical protein [Alicyclobacillus sp.]